MIFSDFQKALSQLFDPRFQSVFWGSLALTIGILIGFAMLVFWSVGALTTGDANIWGVQAVQWVSGALSWGALLVFLILSVFLMVPVASAVTSIFLDRVATAVEEVHYPYLRASPAVSFWEGLSESLRFLGILLACNLGALALYVIFPFAAPIIFLAMNGWLLGREYFVMVAMRRIGRRAAVEACKAHRAEVWMAGCLMALPLSIPIINLTIPVLGAATFTHLYHRVTGRTTPPPL